MTADRLAVMAHPAPTDAAIESDPITADRPETLPGASSPADGPATAPAAQRQRIASPETLRAYAGDWMAFEDWCHKRRVGALPADAATVAEFMTEGAATLSAGTLTRRAAAITAKHAQSGVASPAADPAVRAVLRLARQTATPRRARPKTTAALIRMAAHCPRDLAGMRDRALLLLAANGLSRAALVGLDFEHIRFIAGAVELSLYAVGAPGWTRAVGAKAGAGEGREAPVVVCHGLDPALCPVKALRDWLDTSETQFGPVFRKINRWGTLEHQRLGTDAIRRILERRAPRRGRRKHRVAAT
jgi:hypothetical protein